MQTEFDFIIIGGGTAGCIVASQLIEQERGSVLLLEAGSRARGPDVNVPSRYSNLFQSTRDWNITTVPQTAMLGRSLPYPRARMLGGCSMMNAMIYMEGAVEDWQCEDGTCLPHWSPRDCELAWKRVSDRMHAQQPLVPQFACSRAFLDAGAEMGWDLWGAASSQAKLGIGPFRTTIDRGRRVTSFHRYLKPLLGSRLLQLQTDALVKRLLWKDQRAIGVQADIHGQEYAFRAKQALVVAAGAIHSPAILQRSGIGDRDTLDQLDVPCLVEQPSVGQGLQDHWIVPIIYRSDASQVASKRPSRAERWNYLSNREGPISSNLCEVGGFGKLGAGCSRARDGMPDYQIHVTAHHYLEFPTKPEPVPAMSVGVTWLRPKSSGSVRAVLRNLQLAVDVDPAYFRNADDLDHAVESLIEVRSLGDTEVFHRNQLQEIFPGPRWKTREQWAKIVQRFATTLFHPVGTCRMGCTNDSVVDLQLKVRGVEGLYVVDASVLPWIPRGNTQVPVMMVAERFLECWDRSQP